MEGAGTGVVTAIAIVGAVLAIAQALIAHIKLRMELLPKRLEIFDAYNNYLALAITHGTKPTDKETAEAFALYSRIGFFFNNEVKKVCEDIVKAEFERGLSDRALKRGGPAHAEHAEMNQNAFERLDQSREKMLSAFRPYLNFSTTGLPLSKYLSMLMSWLKSGGAKVVKK